jgi:hypothetical protein
MDMKYECSQSQSGAKNVLTQSQPGTNAAPARLQETPAMLSVNDFLISPLVCRFRVSTHPDQMPDSTFSLAQHQTCPKVAALTPAEV